jgi:hypothetical protein
MGLVQRNQLINFISPPVDNLLATKLVDEFISIERRYIQRDWEPTQLDGGQFCEIASNILYHLDSGNLNYNKTHDECLRYFANDQVIHRLDRKEINHISKVLSSVYKFRSQRGAVHISPTYLPNHMDSKYVVEAVRWIMNEILRIFWNSDREQVAKTIRELMQFDVPSIGIYDTRVLVQRVDLSIEEEIIIMLHYSGDEGLSRSQIGQYSFGAAPTVSNSLKALMSSDKRQVIQLKNGNYRLTDLGNRRIRLELSDKLLVQ